MEGGGSMKHIMLVKVSLVLAFVVTGCNSGNDKSGNDVDTVRKGETGVVQETNDPNNIKSGSKGPINNTITVVATLKPGDIVKVEGKTLSSGSCVNVRKRKVAIVVEKQGLVTTLCSNKDEDNSNDCEGNYNVVYAVDSKEEGTTKLALQASGNRNESEDCTELFNVYTITLKAALTGKTVKITSDGDRAKVLQGKDSCFKLTELDFPVQIDEGKEVNTNRRVLCGSCEIGNYEVGIYGRPPSPDSVVLNSNAEYNKSKSCKWFSEYYMR